MSSRPQWIVGAGALCVLLSGGAVLRAQARFAVVTREAVAIVPGLEIVTVRDSAMNACYTLFVMHPAQSAQIPAQVAPGSVEDAAAQRDQRLSELNAEFENARLAAIPGTLSPDSLKYEWEAQKAQSEFERVLRESEFARLEAWLRQIADSPRLAVGGPGPCGAPAPSPKEQEK